MKTVRSARRPAGPTPSAPAVPLPASPPAVPDGPSATAAAPASGALRKNRPAAERRKAADRAAAQGKTGKPVAPEPNADLLAELDRFAAVLREVGLRVLARLEERLAGVRAAVAKGQCPRGGRPLKRDGACELLGLLRQVKLKAGARRFRDLRRARHLVGRLRKS